MLLLWCDEGSGLALLYRSPIFFHPFVLPRILYCTREGESARGGGLEVLAVATAARQSSAKCACLTTVGDPCPLLLPIQIQRICQLLLHADQALRSRKVGGWMGHAYGD